jgi:hypothetical protein
VNLRTGDKVSSFAYEAILLDEGVSGRNWSKGRELAARGFQSWCEDRLSANGQRNDYLSCFADNKYYLHPLLGQMNPFPEGEERERINTAFDHLVGVLRKNGTFTKAFNLMVSA